MAPRASAQIVVKACASDETAAQIFLRLLNGFDMHPSVRRGAQVVKPKIDHHLINPVFTALRPGTADGCTPSVLDQRRLVALSVCGQNNAAYPALWTYGRRLGPASFAGHCELDGAPRTICNIDTHLAHHGGLSLEGEAMSCQRCYWSAAMVLLIGCATQSLAQDRVSAANALERWCENRALSDPHFVGMLKTIHNVQLPAFCDCFSRQVITGFSGRQITIYMSTGRFPPTMTTLGETAAKDCLLSLMR
jgi:hypothetical protein